VGGKFLLHGTAQLCIVLLQGAAAPNAMHTPSCGPLLLYRCELLPVAVQSIVAAKL
jgi:hypothetical protein